MMDDGMGCMLWHKFFLFKVTFSSVNYKDILGNIIPEEWRVGTE